MHLVCQRLVTGKSFKCTQCGVCCTGAGEVWVNEADCRRLAEHLEIKELDDFLQQYTKSYARKAGWWLLRSVGDSQVTLGIHCSCTT